MPIVSNFPTDEKVALDKKQDKLTGSAGQLIGIGDDGAAKATVYPSNKDLLRNSYFIGGGSQRGEGHFPINQFGKPEYPAFTYPDVAYCIDGWIYGKGLSGVSLKADGLTITKNDTLGYGLFAQRLDSGLCEYLANKTVTLSALVKGSGRISIGNMNVSSSQKKFDIDSTEYQLIANSYTFPSSTATFTGLPFIGVENSGDSITIAAMKFELGPVQTLAHEENGKWVLNVPPHNYSLELAKCQRYQFVVSGKGYKALGVGVARNTSDIYVHIPTPVTLRGAVSTSNISVDKLLVVGAEGYINDCVINSNNSAAYGDGEIVVPITSPSTNLVKGAAYECYVDNGMFIIDLNL